MRWVVSDSVEPCTVHNLYMRTSACNFALCPCTVIAEANIHSPKLIHIGQIFCQSIIRSRAGRARARHAACIVRLAKMWAGRRLADFILQFRPTRFAHCTALHSAYSCNFRIILLPSDTLRRETLQYMLHLRSNNVAKCIAPD